jgi:drug/metabolite transporter (DMT)-like permease
MGSPNKTNINAPGSMRKGIFYLLGAAFAWSWPNVMIRILKADFDIFTQSFYRYIGASVFLFTIGFIFKRKKMIHAAVNLKILLIPSLIMTVHQVFYTTGVFMTSAVVSSLIGRLNAVIIPALSLAFYLDERQVVKSKGFILGSLVAFVGVAGVILGKGQNVEGGFNIGIAFVLLGTLSWSVYAVYIKKVIRLIDPLAIISYVSLISVVLFLPLVLKFGDIKSIVNVPLKTNLLLFGSGILGVGVGNFFYYYAVKYVGTSISSIFFLLLPFSIGILGFFILGETLTIIQLVSGLFSIVGCWMVTGLSKTKKIDG